MLSSVSLLINWLTSLNELHVIQRVLSRLQMKTSEYVKMQAKNLILQCCL